MKNKKIILSLIRDSLINYKLIDGLGKMGLNADDYYLDIPFAIFSLIGFKETGKEETLLDDFYFDLIKKVSKIKIHKHPKRLNDLCLDIFIELQAKKIAMREGDKSFSPSV